MKKIFIALIAVVSACIFVSSATAQGICIAKSESAFGVAVSPIAGRAGLEALRACQDVAPEGEECNVDTEAGCTEVYGTGLLDNYNCISPRDISLSGERKPVFYDVELSGSKAIMNEIESLKKF